jgi:hypothetical protein
MIVALAGIVFITRMVIRVIEMRQSNPNDAQMEAMAHQIAKLEHRIENLETILTSKDFELNQALEELNSKAKK